MVLMVLNKSSVTKRPAEAVGEWRRQAGGSRPPGLTFREEYKSHSSQWDLGNHQPQTLSFTDEEPGLEMEPSKSRVSL